MSSKTKYFQFNGQRQRNGNDIRFQGSQEGKSSGVATNPSSNYEDIRRLSTSIFITNFPRNITMPELWKRCMEWGEVADIFISKRLTKSGKAFGFVRYFKVVSVTDLINNLRTVWFGNYHLYADVTKFERNESNVEVKIESHKPVGKSGSKIFYKSFVEVVSGKNEVEHEGETWKSITIEDEECMDLPDSQHCILAKVIDVDVIRILYNLIRLEGFKDVGIRYVGGRWVWIELGSREQVLLFKQSVSLNKVFVEFKQISEEFVPDERFIWLDFVGLPLKAWTPNAFKKIGGLWGNSVFVDKECDGPVSHGKVCVLTKSMARIDETVKVVIHGKPYQILVKELAYWAPCFENVNEESCENSDSEEEVAGNWSGEENIGLKTCEVDMPDEEKVEEASDPFVVNRLINKMQEDEVRSDGDNNSRLEVEQMDYKNAYDVPIDKQSSAGNAKDKIAGSSSSKPPLMEKENFVGPDSSVVFPSTPLAREDYSNLNHATESCYSFWWLDYVGPSTNEEPDSDNIWCYRDPKGKSHGPFSLQQLHKWSDYLPIDLKIWKRSGTEKESILLHSALKRRATGLKNSNVG